MVNYQSVFTDQPLVDIGLRSTFMNEPGVVMTSCEVSMGTIIVIYQYQYIYIYEANLNKIMI